MENLGVLFVLVGIGLLIVGIVMFILGIFTKTKKVKRNSIITLIGILFFIVGVCFVATSSDTVKNKKSTDIASLKDKNSENDTKIINDFNSFMSENPTFENTVQKFYALTPHEVQTKIWNSDKILYGREVTWSGTVIESMSSRIAIIENDKFNGQDWIGIEPKDSPYVFFAKQAKDTSQFVKGDVVKVKGTIVSRGNNVEGNYSHWALDTISITK